MAKIATTIYLEADAHERLTRTAEALSVPAAVIIRKGLDKELPLWEARARREAGEGGGEPGTDGDA